MRRRAEARNPELFKLKWFQVPELEHALARAGFECFEPKAYGGVIIFKARKRADDMVSVGDAETLWGPRDW